MQNFLKHQKYTRHKLTLAVLKIVLLQSGNMLTDHGGIVYVWPRKVTIAALRSSMLARNAEHLLEIWDRDKFNPSWWTFAWYTCAWNWCTKVIQQKKNVTHLTRRISFLVLILEHPRLPYYLLRLVSMFLCKHHDLFFYLIRVWSIVLVSMWIST